MNVNLDENTNKVSNPAVIDLLGRTIVLQKPKLSDYLNFLKVLGSEVSRNQAYVELACIVLLVRSVDSEDVIIDSLEAIEQLIEKLEIAEDALPKIAHVATVHYLDEETRKAFFKDFDKHTQTILNTYSH